jgi:hypothetical protein
MNTATSRKKKPTGAGKAMLKVLQPIAEELGAEIETDRIAPQVDISKTISHVARTLGQVLHRVNLYRQGEFLVSVDEVTGETKTMRPERFCSWVEDHVLIVKPARSDEGVQTTSMCADLAAKIMAADQFRSGLRELSAVNTVRLPVWDECGKSVRLLDAGYDERTKVFTADTLPYALDMEPEAARTFILDVLKGYPWSDEGRLQDRRSVAVHVAAMLGNYVRLLFKDGTPKPPIVYRANQARSGKTALAEMAVIPTFGYAKIMKPKRSEEEFGKELDTAAINRLPYLLMDNWTGHLVSGLLDSFITASTHGGRRMHSTESYNHPAVTQVFITGNGLTLSTDLSERSLLVDLFYAGEAAKRKFDRYINAQWMVQNRKQFLSAMWSIVNYWQQGGCPRHDTVKPGFEEWSAIVGGIVVEAGFCDPIKRPLEGLDEQADAFKRLFCALVADLPDGTETQFTIADCRAKAEELDIWETLVTGAKDESKAFGRRLRPWIGREWEDSLGRRFQFGRRQNSKGTVYPVNVFPRSAET